MNTKELMKKRREVWNKGWNNIIPFRFKEGNNHPNYKNGKYIDKTNGYVWILYYTYDVLHSIQRFINIG